MLAIVDVTQHRWRRSGAPEAARAGFTFNGASAGATLDAQGYRSIPHVDCVRSHAVLFRMPSPLAAYSAVCAACSARLVTGPGDKNVAHVHAPSSPLRRTLSYCVRQFTCAARP